MSLPNSPSFAISSWALHPLLTSAGAGRLTIFEVPAAIASRGIHKMELCHFHLPAQEPAVMAEMRAACAEAGVELFSLLIDDGDLSHPAESDAAATWIASWLQSGGELGATHARVIAGKQAWTDDSSGRSIRHLRMLADLAKANRIRLLTENWFALLDKPAQVLNLLRKGDGSFGLCLDFGNWHGDSKYSGFGKIAHLMEDCHAKASFHESGEIDTEDYGQCIDITRSAGYAGPYTLVDGGPVDVWRGIELQRDFIRARLH